MPTCAWRSEVLGLDGEELSGGGGGERVVESSPDFLGVFEFKVEASGVVRV